MVVGCIIEWEEHILLCQRAIEPKYGFWTIPAGFMENQETLEEASVRETWEEAKAQVEITSLFGIFSIPAASQVYTIFQGKLRTPDFAAGEESLDVQLVKIHEIPWDQLAFPVMTKALTLYCQDRQRQHASTHVQTIGPHPVP
jgi:ADP-ribose pyrophosphatase YjhB (NUDIX family)